MIKQAYAMYSRESTKFAGVAKCKELADAVIGISNELNIRIIAIPISSEDYVKLREKQCKELMGNFPQDILNRGSND